MMSPAALSRAIPIIERKRVMSCTEELVPIDMSEAREALSLLLSHGKSLWKTYPDDFGEFLHWLDLSHTALAPLPTYQERFQILCGNKRRFAGERLSAGIYILESALKTMDAHQATVETPSLSYRRLIASIPD